MKFSLIVCTYMRPVPLMKLLDSVGRQTLYPDQIIIVDGSLNYDTQSVLEKNPVQNLSYSLATDQQRGLTRQRNYGIDLVDDAIEIVCFLDDDTVLEDDYFENLIHTYIDFPEALGAGGYIANETDSEFVGDTYRPTIHEYYYDGWKRQDGSRFVLRKRLGLDSDRPPGFSPLFSHGRSVGFLPPSGKVYEVEQLMGGVASFRKSVFETHRFSTHFEGYGLYEDADFSLRIAKSGKLYLNTAARLNHYHAAEGRPNHFRYGKMVVRNGWYVWRVKNPSPELNAKLKWHSITILLTVIRFINSVTTTKRREAFEEAMGRTIGWWSLFFSKPKAKTGKT